MLPIAAEMFYIWFTTLSRGKMFFIFIIHSFPIILILQNITRIDCPRTVMFNQKKSIVYTYLSLIHERIELGI